MVLICAVAAFVFFSVASSGTSPVGDVAIPLTTTIPTDTTTPPPPPPSLTPYEQYLYDTVPSSPTVPSSAPLQCKTLPAQLSDDYVTELCMEGCYGDMVVTPRHCKIMAEAQIKKWRTKNGVLAQHLAKVGPHAIRLRFISDAEVVLPRQLFSVSGAQCRYRFPFSLHPEGREGVYHIEAEVLYSQYEAFNEIDKETPPMDRHPLLRLAESRANKGKVIDGAQHHDPTKNLFHFADPISGKILKSGKFRASKGYIWDQFTLSSTEKIRCNGSERTEAKPSVFCKEGGLLPGRWRGVGNAAPLPPADAFTHFERFFPQRLYTYAPDHCVLKGFSRASIVAGLAGKRIVFTGDSHSRVTFVYLANLLRGAEEPLDPQVKQMNGIELLTGSNTTLVLKNDIYLEKHGLRGLAHNFDVVVAGFGSWCLGGGGKNVKGVVVEDVGRWSLARYEKEMERVAKEFVGSAKKVWVTMPAYPPNQRRFAKLKGEYRTNPRIEVFNAAAVAALHAGGGGVAVLDAFSPSLPMVHLSLDHNHHLGYVQNAIIHQLLNILLA